MGSPISGTMVKIFIQHLGDSFVKHLLNSKSITFYSRYVDDILKIYDSSYTNPNAKKQYANTIHNNLQINPSPENAGQISFLDPTFTSKTTSLEIDIFLKPTTNNTTISYLSSHPLEHKLAAYRYYFERMFSLPLNKENPLKEWTTILDIARSNNFPDNILINKLCAASYKIQCLNLTIIYSTAISLILLIFLLQNYYNLWVNPCAYHLLHIRKLQYVAFFSCNCNCNCNLFHIQINP